MYIQIIRIATRVLPRVSVRERERGVSCLLFRRLLCLGEHGDRDAQPERVGADEDPREDESRDIVREVVQVRLRVERHDRPPQLRVQARSQERKDDLQPKKRPHSRKKEPSSLYKNA